MPRIDSVVIADVVAVIAIRGRLERRYPDRVDAERVQVVEAAIQALEVAAAVAVRVHEGVDVEAVDECVLVPEVRDHGAQVEVPVDAFPTLLAQRPTPTR